MRQIKMFSGTTMKLVESAVNYWLSSRKYDSVENIMPT